MLFFFKGGFFMKSKSIPIYALVAFLLLVSAVVVFPVKIVTLGLILGIGLYVFMQPKVGIAFLIMYYPVRPFLIEMNDSLKLLGDIITFFMLAHVVWSGRRQFRSLLKLHWFEWTFLLFVVVGSVSALLTGVSIGSIIIEIRAFMVTFLLFYIVRRLDVSKQDILSYMSIVVAMAVFLSLHGLLEKLTLRQYFLPQSWSAMELAPTNRIRVYGLIGNPNVLAYLLGIAIMMAFYLLTVYKMKKAQILLYVCIVLFSGVFLLTFSRGTTITFVVAAIVFIVLTKKYKLVVPIISVVVIGGALITYPVTQTANYFEKHHYFSVKEKMNKENEGKNRFKKAFSKEELHLSSQDGRLYLIQVGLEIFKDHPIIGTGFGTFGDSAAVANSSPIYKQYGITYNIYSDNQYIQIIAQTGIVGVLLFGSFLIGLALFLWKSRTVPGAYLWLALLLGTYPAGAYYNIWEDKTFTSLFFIGLAIIASYKKWMKPTV